MELNGPDLKTQMCEAYSAFKKRSIGHPDGDRVIMP